MVHPSGQYAYVTNKGSDTVSQFTIGADGKLTPMTPASVASGTHPFRITISANGNYAYVANFGTSPTPGTSVSQYSIVSGALVPMTPPADAVTTGNGPLSVSLAGSYAYVTNYFDQTVSQFTLGAGGGLTLSGTPDKVTGNGPWPITVTPNGQYAYWSNTYDDNITQCAVGAGGALDCSAGTVSSGVAPQFIASRPVRPLCLRGEQW